MTGLRKKYVYQLLVLTVLKKANSQSIENWKNICGLAYKVITDMFF